VDDEEGVRQVAKRMIEHLGFKVILAENGEEGLKKFSENADEINLVILDLTMPQLHGAETFQRLKAINKDIPVLISSGYDEQTALSQFKREGLAGFIQKPYQLQNLAQKIHRILNR
jgi:DNA-binding NtrC family response regulator